MLELASNLAHDDLDTLECPESTGPDILLESWLGLRNDTILWQHLQMPGHLLGSATTALAGILETVPVVDSPLAGKGISGGHESGVVGRGPHWHDDRPGFANLASGAFELQGPCAPGQVFWIQKTQTDAGAGSNTEDAWTSDSGKKLQQAGMESGGLQGNPVSGRLHLGFFRFQIHLEQHLVFLWRSKPPVVSSVRGRLGTPGSLVLGDQILERNVGVHVVSLVWQSKLAPDRRTLLVQARDHHRLAQVVWQMLA